MVRFINFDIKKWQYNKNAPKEGFKTDLSLITNPLRSRMNGPSEGLGLTWILTITAKGIEVLYYSAQEMIIIDDKNISDTHLFDTLRISYDHAYAAMAPKNLAVGLNAGFPPFEGIITDLSEIRAVLHM